MMMITTYGRDGLVRSDRWLATGKVNEAPSPLDFVGVGGIPKLAQTTGRTFWSGYPVAMREAAARAKANRGVTLEQTLAGKGLSVLQAGAKELLNDEARAAALMAPAWRSMSKSFARGAKGEVQAFLRKDLSPTSIWKTVEEPILRNKNEITRRHIGG